MTKASRRRFSLPLLERSARSSRVRNRDGSKLVLAISRRFPGGRDHESRSTSSSTRPSGDYVARMVSFRPLEGIRVVDLTANMTGPMATLVLADQGADVVKIEPPQGDVVRRVGPGANGTSAYFANLNRGKRSVVVDLSSAEGIELVRSLADGADVFVENFRPGVAARLGLGATELQARNNRLVYASISGFGPEGPMSAAPAYDHIVQALSGIAARQAPRGGAPALVRHGVVDKATGLTAAQAITAALLARERGAGPAAVLDIAMLDVALSFLWPDGMMTETCLDPVSDTPGISQTFRTTATADGFVALITVTDEQFRNLLRAVEREDLLDERVARVEERGRHGGAVMREVGTILAAMSTVEVVERLGRHDVPCAPVVALPDVVNQEIVRARGSVAEVDDPLLGRIVQPISPTRLAGEPGDATLPLAPALGADTDEVLAEAGLDARRVAELRAGGVIG